MMILLLLLLYCVTFTMENILEHIHAHNQTHNLSAAVNNFKQKKVYFTLWFCQVNRNDHYREAF